MVGIALLCFQTGIAVTRVLVLVPTRELGVQVYQVSKELAQFTSVEFGLAVGGLDVKTQESYLRKQPDIVIATPGRLIDHIKNTPGFALDCIEVLVLDEADRCVNVSSLLSFLRLVSFSLLKFDATVGIIHLQKFLLFLRSGWVKFIKPLLSTSVI